MIAIQREAIDELHADPALPGLAYDYVSEAGSHRFPPDPDWEAMAVMESVGELGCFTMRLDGELVGALIFSIQPMLGCRGKRFALAEFIYTAPDHRGPENVRRLLQAAAADMKGMGAQRMVIEHGWSIGRSALVAGLAAQARVLVKDL